MSKNSLKIRGAIKQIAENEPEILSGTVVQGSLNTGLQTVDVTVTAGGRKIEGVSISSITGNGNGLIIVPKDNSNVIIGSVDGPGEWSILKTNELEKLSLKIEDAIFSMDGTEVTLRRGNAELQISATAFKIGTYSESLYSLLKDLVTAIKAITVAGTPIHGTATASLTLLSTRIDNLLTA